MPKLTPKVILEGTRLTLKTEIAFALNEHPCVVGPRSGNPSQYDDLGLFVNEQELMRRLVGESILPVYELDVSHGDVGRAADEVVDWLERTGGLWMA